MGKSSTNKSVSSQLPLNSDSGSSSESEKPEETEEDLMNNSLYLSQIQYKELKE